MRSHQCLSCDEYSSLSRRSFLQVGGGAMLAASVPAWLPQVVLAKDHRAKRQIIVSVFLRGGADGLTLCVPHADPLYYASAGPTSRPTLAIARPGEPDGCTDLDGAFGLAPAMSALKEPFDNGHMAVVHAAGLNDPTRSHFDAMRFMEIGVAQSGTLFTGWLGRHLMTSDPVKADAALRGIGVGLFSTPLTMNGGPQSTPVPYPEYYGLAGHWQTQQRRLDALRTMYNAQPASLKNAAKTTVDTIELLDRIDFANYQPAGGAVYPASHFGNSLKASAALIKAEVGVEAICVDRGDWDTHSDQGPLGGTLAENMTDLSQGLLAFYRDVFAFTTEVVVVVMSEFGRRVEENASRGTDHGHGNAMFVLGGRVNGRKVYCKDLNGNPGWVGLGSLYEDLDLHITTDYRDVLAEIVYKSLGNTRLDQIFPNYTPQFQGIIG